LVFTGTYEHSIDSKNRLAIPAEIRALIQADADRAATAAGRSRKAEEALELYATLGEGGLLSLYTPAGFEKRAEELDHSELDPAELLVYESLKYSLSRRLEVDKQGRVRLPEDLLAQAKLGREVVLLGVKDHLQIRDRQTWKEFVENVLATQPGILMNPRLAMKATR